VGGWGGGVAREFCPGWKGGNRTYYLASVKKKTPPFLLPNTKEVEKVGGRKCPGSNTVLFFFRSVAGPKNYEKKGGERWVGISRI